MIRSAPFAHLLELLLSTTSPVSTAPTDPQPSGASVSDGSSLASSTQSLTASTGVEAAPQSETTDAANQSQADFEVGETAASQGGDTRIQRGLDFMNTFFSRSHRVELGWSKVQQVLYAVVEKLIGHTANTDEDKVFQLCLDIFKEICIVGTKILLSRF